MAYDSSPISVPRFVLVKGMTNTFTFYVKARGELEPLELVPSDTFQAYLRNKQTGQPILGPIDLTIGEPEEGEISLTIPMESTLNIPRDVGTEADRSYLKALHSLYIQADTAAQGSFIIRLEDVYVD